MTAQVAERLQFSGEELDLACEPLEVYFTLAGKKPAFGIHSTACWRGYIGTWTIENERLYLVQIDGRLGDGRIATISDVFPGHAGRIFAHWYTGQLRFPRGRLLNYVHGGYQSTYERDLLINVKRGLVTKISERVNGKAESEDSEEGYQVGAWTTLNVRPVQTDTNHGTSGSKSEATR